VFVCWYLDWPNQFDAEENPFLSLLVIYQDPVCISEHASLPEKHEKTEKVVLTLRKYLNLNVHARLSRACNVLTQLCAKKAVWKKVDGKRKKKPIMPMGNQVCIMKQKI